MYSDERLWNGLWVAIEIGYASLFHSLTYNTTMKSTGFEIKNGSEVQGCSSSKSIGILTVVQCIWDPDLEILPSICGDFLAQQAQNGVNFDFEVQFEGQGQSSHKTIGILTKVFYTSGPNLVILA